MCEWFDDTCGQLLDHLDELAREVGIDPAAQCQALASLATRYLGLARVDAGDVDTPFGKLLVQDVGHLLELEIALRLQRNDGVLEIVD